MILQKFGKDQSVLNMLTGVMGLCDGESSLKKMQGHVAVALTISISQDEMTHASVGSLDDFAIGAGSGRKEGAASRKSPLIVSSLQTKMASNFCRYCHTFCCLLHRQPPIT